jgi:hypothetical protein
MPLDLEQTIEMTPVETGDMSEIPPDLPDGEWVGSFVCKASHTSEAKGSYPMLVIDAIAEEANTEGNEDAVGAKATQMVCFFPANHSGAKMSKIRLKQLCEAYEIDPPDTSSLAENPPTWESLVPFVEALESQKRLFWTKNVPDKKTGENRTELFFMKPGSKVRAPAPDDDAPAKPAKTLAKKTNGAAAKKSTKR